MCILDPSRGGWYIIRIPDEPFVFMIIRLEYLEKTMESDCVEVSKDVSFLASSSIFCPKFP